jgi:hypothetical protein
VGAGEQPASIATALMTHAAVLTVWFIAFLPSQVRLTRPHNDESVIMTFNSK